MTDKNDYYLATIEDGTLVMRPHCKCGNPLTEDYFCEKCKRQCQCMQIACEDVGTLQHVKHLISGSPKFRHFQAYKK